MDVLNVTKMFCFFLCIAGTESQITAGRATVCVSHLIVSNCD